MPVSMYSFKLRRNVPMLSDEEFEPIEKALFLRIRRIQEYRLSHPTASIGDARRYSVDHALDLYEDMTGVRLADPDELYAVQLSLYGRPCPQCGKPFRTPRARFCAECGLGLPSGEVAGPASAPAV
jgi:hypothetical protein